MPCITSIENHFKLCSPDQRKPRGIGISPYPLLNLIRYLINSLFRGCFSYINPDFLKMKLLGRSGRLIHESAEHVKTSAVKIAFLGDFMVSKRGLPPQLSAELKKILQTADVIIANIESPIVNSGDLTKRGLSLNFKMEISYLKEFCKINEQARLVLNLANNHAGDTSLKNDQDITGIQKTVDHIRRAIPTAEIIGAEVGAAKSVLSLQIAKGPRIGVIGWTGLMNRDKLHHKKPIVRMEDLKSSTLEKIKEGHDRLIGFAHDNEEHSYYPLKKTRDQWLKLLGKGKFDLIVGHGPHVIQPAELVNKTKPLFHSIGNFFSPIGQSPTKVGCLPVITFHYKDRQIYATDYEVNIIQQEKEFLSLTDIHAKDQRYPNVIKRLKKIWKPLFL